MLGFREYLQEEAVPANCAGGGQIAGIGVGPEGEPGVPAGVKSSDKKSRKKSPLMKMLDRWLKK